MHDTLIPAVALSDDLAMLLEAATGFCRDHSSSAAVRKRLGSDSGFDAAHWQAMADMGWLGIAVPEAHGGSGLGLAGCAVLAEPLGRHLLHTPFVATQLAIHGLVAGASAAQQAAWLPRLASGAIGSVALFEDDGDWDLTALQSRTVAPTNTASPTLALSGHKTLVPDAAVADIVLVSVLHDGAPALALLSRSDLAGRLQRETVIDETRRSFRLRLDGLHIERVSLVTGSAALQALRAIRQAAWLLAAAEAAGGMAGVLALVVDYLNTRSAFGRKIGSYQALKHGCADMLCSLERVRSHVFHAATLLADSNHAPQDAEVALRMAKADAGDAYVQTGDRAVQFHGGFGFTWDCDAQLHLRRALWLQPWFGDAAHHRRHLAGLLLGSAAAAA